MNDGPVVAFAVIVVVVGVLYLTSRPKPEAGSPVPEGAPLPRSFTRLYRGSQQADAVRLMRIDADELAEHGYQITSQSWAPGQWGCGAFLVALILFIVIIGIFVFLYMLLVKPQGTLSVTYTLRDAPASPAPRSPSSNAMDDLARLAELRDRGAITPDEYDRKKADLLARI